MPDISLCVWSAEACELASRCYRHTAEPNDVRQSYFCPERPGKKCRYFIAVRADKPEPTSRHHEED